MDRKFKCNSCESDNPCIIDIGDTDDKPNICPMGYDYPDGDCEWEEINTPKHETVEEWEKRTGESYPDDALVIVWSLCSEEYQMYKYHEVGYSNSNRSLIVVDLPSKPEV